MIKAGVEENSPLSKFTKSQLFYVTKAAFACIITLRIKVGGLNSERIVPPGGHVNRKSY